MALDTACPKLRHAHPRTLWRRSANLSPHHPPSRAPNGRQLPWNRAGALTDGLGDIAVVTGGLGFGTAVWSASLLEDEGILFTGDALANYAVLTHATGLRLMPDALNGDPARTRQSLSAHAKADAGTLRFGHGEPFHGAPADAVTQAHA